MLGVLATGKCILARQHAQSKFLEQQGDAACAHPSQAFTQGPQGQPWQLGVQTAHPSAILQGQQEQQRQPDEEQQLLPAYACSAHLQAASSPAPDHRRWITRDGSCMFRAVVQVGSL
jgi:hypothetical protein